MKYSILFSIILFATSLIGSSYTVGPGNIYASPNALYQAKIVQDGDTIFLEAGDYAGNEALAVWSEDSLYIKGINGRPHLQANGQYIIGKGIWVLGGDHITVDNIEFSGAAVPDKNGAGIRVDGSGFTIRHCYFHDNENGILANPQVNSKVLIEYSEFDNNGHGDGLSHNLYINDAEQLIFQFNYSHHAVVGHCLKSRARENIIRYNRIMDENDGNSSRLIDLSNGGFSVIIGNLLMQGPQAENNNLIGYGLEGLGNGGIHELYVVNNTMINRRVTGRFLHINSSVSTAELINNIVGGVGQLNEGPLSANSNNYIETDISLIGLVDESNYNYRLLESSNAIDRGAALGPAGGNSLVPGFQYVHSADNEFRSIMGEAIDIGAYEYDIVSADEIVLYDNGINIYPNPTQDDLRIDVVSGSYSLKIYNSGGSILLDTNIQDDYNINLAPFQNGVYFLELINQANAQVHIRSILKY